MSEKYFFVYMMASGKRGTIYIGVTSDLLSRVRQHKDHQYKDSFTDRYDVTTLVWYEALGDAESAITREKQMKEWRRAWKVELIQKTNPQWRDLWDEVLALYGYREYGPWSTILPFHRPAPCGGGPRPSLRQVGSVLAHRTL
jgi:putative endonuclease